MQAERVYLENTQARIIHLPANVRKDPKTGHVTLEGSGAKLVPSVKKDGIPELTSVAKDYWDRKKNHPCVKAWMKLGWIKVHDKSSPGADMPDTLAKYNARTAISIVEGEEDAAVLKQWADSELRDDVSAALTARIAQLDKSKKA